MVVIVRFFFNLALKRLLNYVTLQSFDFELYHLINGNTETYT